MIPRKIHYCWFGPKPIPKLLLKCIDTWKRVMPCYEFYFWNERNSPLNNPFVESALKAKKYAFASDYVRFWALYHYGGIYLDADMYVVKKFDNLLNNKIFFGWENDLKSHLSCGVIGSESENLFIEEVVNHYNSIRYSKKNISDLIVPRIVTRIYNSYKNKNEITIYPSNYFYSFPYDKREDIKNFKRYLTGESYAVHLWNMSWLSPHQKILKILEQTKKKLSKYIKLRN